MIKLSELKAARAAMTPGEWHVDNGTAYGGNNEIGDFEVAEFSNNNTYDDSGIIATHNAADVLIEIAEAALDYREASSVLARFGDGDAFGRSILAGDVGAAQARLTAALAKVQP